MSKLNWLHFTDLHWGMNEQKQLWPNIKEQFYSDLSKLHERSGPWNVVLFTGDLVRSGSQEEFESLNRLLEELWSHFNKLGSNPLLVPIPGNHDLIRPDSKSPTVRLLTKWTANPEIHEEFWEDSNSQYRTVVNTAFTNYSKWLEASPFTNTLKKQSGLVPGDLSVTIEHGDIKIGVIGLNTAFLQITESVTTGGVALSSRQFHEVCQGDGPQWINQHTASLLLTHHPLSWLNDQSQEKDWAEIAPAGRFAVHLFGHMHEPVIRTEARGGGRPQRAWQGCSLFGLESYGYNNEHTRRHGYSSGQIEIVEDVGYIRTWPRIAQWDKTNGWRITSDNMNFILELDEGTNSEKFDVKTSNSSRGFSLLSNDLSLPLATRTTMKSLVKPTGTEASQWPYEDPALRAYCDALIKSHGCIRFVEVPYLKDTSDVEIENLYVIPQISQQEIHADIEPHSWPKCVNAISALEKYQRIVLLGDPGSGKSTLISNLTWQLSRPRATKSNQWLAAFGGLVPIPMVLRELKLKTDLTWEGLLDAFLAQRTGKLIGTRTHLEALFENGRAIVLLDGLDEIGNITIRRKLRDAVYTGMAAYPSSRWVLTSRIVGYDQVPFHVVVDEAVDKSAVTAKRRGKAKGSPNQIAELTYLAPFSDEQIKTFAHNWYNQHEKDAVVVNESADDLVEAVHDNEGTRRLARIPFLLTLMALIHHKNARLPHGRTELYDRIAAAYLESIDVRRELAELPYSLAQKKRWLAEIAYQIQVRRTRKKNVNGSGREILASKRDVRKWLIKAMTESGAENARQEAGNLLDYFARRSGLLLPRGEGQFAFMHLSLQEYFAACYIESRLTASRFSPIRRKLSPTDAQLHSWANNSVWSETFILLFELLANRDVTDSEDLLKHLFDTRFKKDFSGTQGTALRLLSELTVDSYVTLSAATRMRMRQECWLWEFGLKSESTTFRSWRGGQPGIARTLLFEFGADLAKAWQAAGLSRSELKSKVKALNLSGCTSLTDLTPIGHLTGLRDLYLDGCTHLTDLTPLGKLKSLEELSLDGSLSIVDIEPLKSLRALRTLNLDRCTSLENFEPLSDLSDLKTLFVSDCEGVEHLTTIAKLSKLETLMIGRVDADLDLRPLATLSTLKSIHLHRVQGVIDLTPLFSLPNLLDVCTLGSGLVEGLEELEQKLALRARQRKRRAQPRITRKSSGKRISKSTSRVRTSS